VIDIHLDVTFGRGYAYACVWISSCVCDFIYVDLSHECMGMRLQLNVIQSDTVWQVLNWHSCHGRVSLQMEINTQYPR
jgi:hypothetical protein